MSNHPSTTRKDPLWAQILESLGWLIDGIGVIAIAVAIWVGFRSVEARLTMLPALAGLGSAVLMLGQMLIAISQSARSGQAKRRWGLWAKLLMLLGGIFCISIPVCLYGAFQATLPIMAAMESHSASLPITHVMESPPPSGPPSLLDHAVIAATLQASGIPFVVGACFFMAAIFFGKCKASP